MGIIHKLPEEIVSQIAAGEVVERPAHVVKELVENAIDASATEIEINLAEYGLGKIEVIDNGEGMSKEDLLQSFLPHTTSKLSAIEDLHTISTLGFRGEALNSIAAVSTITIASREKKADHGYQIKIFNGEQSVTQIGKSVGTRVIVEDLFANVPARKKFLKSPLTELRIITDIVSHYALLHPTISFRLTHNNKTLIDESVSSLQTRIENLWGEDTFIQLLPLTYDSTNIALRGFIGKPQLNSTSAQKLILFLNKRRVEDKLIANATREAFGTLLMTRAYPIGVMFLTTPQEFIDVNVHPTKREVRFVHADEVFTEVKNAISELLLAHNLTYQNVSFKSGSSQIKSELKEEIEKSDIAQLGHVDSTEIIQIHESYLIKEVAEGLIVIDQHAAHESLLYFEFLKAWEQKKKSTKPHPLPSPVIIPLTTSEELLLTEYMDRIQKIGFTIEEFGSHTYRVTHAPALYADQDISVVITDLLEAFTQTPKGLSDKEHHFLATLACKSAIKAGMPLNQAQRHELCDYLQAQHFAYTCPHGRPVKVEISLSELAKMFKRA